MKANSVDLAVRLYDVIDAKTLGVLTNTIDRQPWANLRVEFPYRGYAVTVVESGKRIIGE
ncbi:HalOD1 output domain-containing protein [Natronoglomus mannanivorans]|uniref:HalOD1 output domain-containing protein n=1 Tax=Natronoglomus mannanivorans TaxID=2979990 RepID=UPI003CCE4722